VKLFIIAAYLCFLLPKKNCRSVVVISFVIDLQIHKLRQRTLATSSRRIRRP